MTAGCHISWSFMNTCCCLLLPQGSPTCPDCMSPSASSGGYLPHELKGVQPQIGSNLCLTLSQDAPLAVYATLYQRRCICSTLPAARWLCAAAHQVTSAPALLPATVSTPPTDLPACSADHSPVERQSCSETGRLPATWSPGLAPHGCTAGTQKHQGCSGSLRGPSWLCQSCAATGRAALPR